MMRALIAILILIHPIVAIAQGRSLIDWDKIGDESIDFMVDLVRIDTSNPPGNETEVVDYLKAVLAKERVPFEIYALDPDRANLVARYKGNGSKPPVLIMGHTDVVGVQADKWTEPPFGALCKDGYIWGRGTLDDKDNLTAGLMVMLMLHRLDIEMERTLGRSTSRIQL